MAITILLAWSISGHAATYYVDFDAGNDASTGRSPDSAFQHAPGDPAAEAQAKATRLEPGDVVRFKGGVVYRGTVTVTRSGTPEKPIVLRGNLDGEYGSGAAIIHGGEYLAGLQPLHSAADVGDNPNWKNIFVTDLPESPTKSLGWNLIEDGKLMFLAEGPPPENPHLWVPGHYRKVPASQATRTSVVDPELQKYGGRALIGATIQVHCKPSWIRYCEITGFDPETNTLTFEDNPQMGPYYDTFNYSLLNHVRLISRPGDYAVDEESGKVYVWPYAAGQPGDTSITMSVRPVGIQLAEASHVTIEGLDLRGFAAGRRQDGGSALRVNGPCEGVVIRKNRMSLNRSTEKKGVLYVNDLKRGRIVDNELFHNPLYRVMLLDRMTDTLIEGNVVRESSGTGIVCFRGRNLTIRKNHIEDLTAIHSQGMAIYADCRGVLIEENTQKNGTAVTVNGSREVTIRKNEFDAGGHGISIGLWSGQDPLSVDISENVMKNNAADGWAKGISVFSNNDKEESRYSVTKNVLQGVAGQIPPSSVSENVFTSPVTFEKFAEGNSLKQE